MAGNNYTVGSTFGDASRCNTECLWNPGTRCGEVLDRLKSILIEFLGRPAC